MIDKFFKNGDEKSEKKKKMKGTKASLPPLVAADSVFEFLKEGSVHTDKPPFKGEIPLPTPKPGCLSNIKFSIAGTLPHFTRNETSKKLFSVCSLIN